MDILSIGNLFHSQSFYVKDFSKTDSETSIEKTAKKIGGAALVTTAVAKFLGFNSYLCANICQTQEFTKFFEELNHYKLSQKYLCINQQSNNEILTIYNHKGERQCYTYLKNGTSVKSYNDTNKVWDIVFFCCLDAEIVKSIIETKSIKSKHFVLLASGLIYDYFKKDRCLIDGIDFLFVNAGEAKNLSQTEDIHKTYSDLQNKINGKLIITLGEEGALCSVNGEQIIFPTLYKPNIVHLGGAGDAFATGFTTSFIQNFSINESMNKGHQTASKIIEVINPLDILR